MRRSADNGRAVREGIRKMNRSLKEMFDGYLGAVSPEYAYQIAYELSTNPAYFNNAKLGGRQAGSRAEHAAAEYLCNEMRAIGLEDVEKVPARCDRWQFNGASLTVKNKEYALYTYATASTPPEGITAEIVYAGRGTRWDYEGLDVRGRIVLVDINQRDDWWITYPMLEAQHQGAAAILAANVGGFAQIADDALNSQDICGPTSIPTCSIGVADAREIRALLEKGPTAGTLVVDNEVEIGKGVTYNLTGRIRGRRSDYQILAGGHYDTHFFGFQDDSCAVALVLAMAKAMIESGYRPENDIVICLHGAEEWGSSYTQFDWTVGAWEMINRVHPEWVGRTLAFINLELPAYEFASYTTTYSAPEMYSLLDTFAHHFPYAPKPKGCFPDGVLTEGYQTYAYSDDFSYYAAGVPSTVNGFLLQRDMKHVFPFYVDCYHTQYDTHETYNAAVMDFNLRYYGALAMYIDQSPALYLDFTAQYARVSQAMHPETMARAGCGMEEFRAALAALLAASAAMKERVLAVNSAYERARQAGDDSAMEALRAEGRALTAQNLAAFRFAQKNLLGLMYEQPIVPHEAPQETIELCEEIIACLQRGDPATAVDEYALTVNNVLERYAMYFSPEVIAVQDHMVWGAENQHNLYWGTDINFSKADVDAATRSLYRRYGEAGGDFTEEIAVYRAAIAVEKTKLRESVQAEAAAMHRLAQMLAEK